MSVVAFLFFILIDLHTFIDKQCAFYFRADWLYSEKYDREHASIQRSIERTATRGTTLPKEQESTA